MKVKKYQNKISDMNEVIIGNTGVVVYLGVKKVSPGVCERLGTHIFASEHGLVKNIFFSGHFSLNSKNDGSSIANFVRSAQVVLNVCFS
jgi:hypothetical protein